MSWHIDVLSSYELGSRVAIYLRDEEMFVHNFGKRHAKGERFHSQIRKGRWVHPLVEMMLHRIEHPEWIYDPQHERPPEPERLDMIVLYAKEAQEINKPGPMDVNYEDPMVPCVVCGAEVPEMLGICPGPLDGSASECEREALIAGTHPKLKHVGS